MYTKGEWTIHGRSRHSIVIAQDNNLIAEVEINEAQAEAEANARLIASAPDCYEALKMWEDWFYQRGVNKPPITQSTKAIAKAEGGK